MYVYSPLLFHTLQLFGLLPFSVRHLPLGRQVATVSRPLVYYSYLLAALFCGSFGLWIHDSFYSEQSKDPQFWTNVFTTTSVVTIVSSNLFGLTTAVVCVIDAGSRSGKRIQMLEKLREVDFQLQRRDVAADTRHVSILTFLFASVLWSLDTYSFKMLEGQNITFEIDKMILVMAVLEFAELVFNVHDRFRLVNERTLEVVRRTRSQQEVWTTALPAVETFTMPQEQSMSIPMINLVHWELCCLISDINDLYALKLTVISAMIFYNLVSFNFSFYLIFLYEFNLLVFASIIGWSLMFLIQFFVLAWPCSLTVAEAKRTAAVVAKLLGSRIGKTTKAELEVFLKQLFLRDVEFSVSGLFTLQTSVILPVLGAVTTYLAVIIQLKKSVPQTSPSNNTTM